jgi:hypothetical protein
MAEPPLKRARTEAGPVFPVRIDRTVPLHDSSGEVSGAPGESRFTGVYARDAFPSVPSMGFYRGEPCADCAAAVDAASQGRKTALEQQADADVCWNCEVLDGAGSTHGTQHTTLLGPLSLTCFSPLSPSRPPLLPLHLLFLLAGHWCATCPKGPGEFLKSLGEMNAPNAPAALPSLFSLSTAAVITRLSDHDSPAAAVAEFDRMLSEVGDKTVPWEVFASDVYPHLKFGTLDRLYYTHGTRAGLSSEAHAIALRRTQSAARHLLYKEFCRANGLIPTVTANVVPVSVMRDDTWDVVGDHAVLFTTVNMQRDAFERESSARFFCTSSSRAKEEEENESGKNSTPLLKVPHANLADIQANVDRLSSGLLEGLAWQQLDVVLAGGAVLASLIMDTSQALSESPFSHSDIDLFLLPRSRVAFADRVRLIGQHLIDRHVALSGLHANHYCVYTTPCAVTFYFEGVYPAVQVIDASFLASVPQLLASFDVDCCAVAFDGHRVIADPRCVRALTKGFVFCVLCICVFVVVVVHLFFVCCRSPTSKSHHVNCNVL